MSNSETNSGCFFALIFIVHIVAIFGSGYYAWNWIEPESFWGGIKFLIAWGIIGAIADLLLISLASTVASIFE